MKECNLQKIQENDADLMPDTELMANFDSKLSVKGAGVNRGKSLTNLNSDALNTMMANKTMNSTLS